MMMSLDEIFERYDELKNTIYPDLDVFLNRISDIELAVTGMCNLSCSYCYFNRWTVENKNKIYKQRFMDPEVMDIALSEFKKFNEFKEKLNIDTNRSNVTLFGGDAMASLLVNNDMFETLLNLFNKYKTKNTGALVIPANGVYPGWEKNDWFKELITNSDVPTCISLSVDGPIDFQIKQRCSSNWWNNEYPEYAVNYNTQEEFDENFFSFLKFLKTNKLIELGFHPMLTPYTFKHPNEFYSYYKKILKLFPKFEVIGLLHVRNKDLNNEVTYEDAIKFSDATVEFYKDTGVHTWLSHHDTELYGIGSLFNKRAYSCSIFSTLFVDLDGVLNLCHRFKFLKDPKKYELGYINKQDRKLYLDLDKICKFYRYSKQDKNGCKDCLVATSCAGDCLAETVYNYDNLSVNDESICHINRIMMFMKLRTQRLIKEYKDGIK